MHLFYDMVQRGLAREHAGLGRDQTRHGIFHSAKENFNSLSFGQQAGLAYLAQAGLHRRHLALHGGDQARHVASQAGHLVSGLAEHRLADIDADGLDGKIDLFAGIMDAHYTEHVAVGRRQPAAALRQLQLDQIQFFCQA